MIDAFMFSQKCLTISYINELLLLGARFGRRATWIGASGDQTYMRIDESLINAHILASSKVFANHTSIGRFSSCFAPNFEKVGSILLSACPSVQKKFKDYTNTMGSNSVETFIDSFGF